MSVRNDGLTMRLFFLGWLVGMVAAVPVWGDDPEPEPLPLEELRLFSEVFGKIKSEYVEPVDDATLLRHAIQGMLSGLDPHSTFLSPDDVTEIRITTDGQFGGLGIEITSEDGLIKVVAPIDGTPAWHAGIQAGDMILQLDGESVRGMALRDAVTRMRGVPGSEIILTIAREGLSEPIEVRVVRAIIKVTSVKGQLLEPGFGYLRVSQFQSNTARNLRNQVQFLGDENGAPLTGWVLDLRNNPGGVLSAAVEVSDLFLSTGDIVSTRGRAATSAQQFSASPDDIAAGAPLVVLVNGGSASASEIVAGALQDHQRAIILGTKTFGKGSVQTVIPMSNRGALKLTTARYYTPTDRLIQARGIVPDIIARPVELTPTADEGQPISEADLHGHLENSSDQQDKPNESGAALVATDSQLREALNLIKGMVLVKQRLDTAVNAAANNANTNDG